MLTEKMLCYITNIIDLEIFLTIVVLFKEIMPWVNEILTKLKIYMV